MRKLIVLVVTVLSLLMVSPVMASEKDTSNFYFSDFTADYYLSRDEEGVSHLRVEENLTAEFPNYEQNKGLVRQIPFTNQGGRNITMPKLDNSDIKLLRNDAPEPIWSLQRIGDHYELETGTDDYVLGTQKYTIEYEFEKVITDFGEYQELYWDTNGNGWPQRFDKLTARLHFDKDLLKDYNKKPRCYVGRYGEKGESRCKIENTDDGFIFSTKNLRPYENLTFATKIRAGTFVVPEPEESYALVIATAVLVFVCMGLIILRLVHNKPYSEKIRKYKKMFVAPQYQPNAKYSLTEMAEIYLGKKKDVKVGVLLGMLVDKKVELKKKDEGGLASHSWGLVVKTKDKMTAEEEAIMLLLNGGEVINDGDEIELKKRIATSELEKIGKAFDAGILDSVKKDGLVDSGYKLGDTGPLDILSGVGSIIILSLISLLFFTIPIGLAVFAISNLAIDAGKFLVYEDICMNVAYCAIFVMVFVFFWCSNRKKIISKITEKGLIASNYMEGLKLYIEMAEADRMKVLQSVKGADVTGKGIVKLYEKLLPYAAVFGLEESWMKEMKKYCELNKISEPDYMLTGITAYELSHSMRSAAGYASNSGHSVAGGGSFSSSSSGSGGGGFSGGGGGGGGGGGR